MLKIKYLVLVHNALLDKINERYFGMHAAGVQTNFAESYKPFHFTLKNEIIFRLDSILGLAKSFKISNLSKAPQNDALRGTARWFSDLPNYYLHFKMFIPVKARIVLHRHTPAIGRMFVKM